MLPGVVTCGYGEGSPTSVLIALTQDEPCHVSFWGLYLAQMDDIGTEPFDELDLLEQGVTLREVTQVDITLVRGQLVELSGTCGTITKDPTTISSVL